MGDSSELKEVNLKSFGASINSYGNCGLSKLSCLTFSGESKQRLCSLKIRMKENKDDQISEMRSLFGDEAKFWFCE